MLFKLLNSAALMAALFAFSGCKAGHNVTSVAEAGKSVSAQDVKPLERPNIFLITLEDLSSKFGSFGDPIAHTPNIDRLAQEGIKFPNVFTTAGVCAPSRSSLITGVHQQTLGTMHMRTSSFGRDMPYGAPYEAVPPAEVKAFPELLRAEGYYALNNAKTDYQFGKPFTVWDEDSSKANWKNAPADKPLFAMINFNQTHESYGFPTTIPYEGPNANRNAKSFVPRNIKFDKTKSVITNPARVTVPPYYPDTPEVRASIARYYDNVARTDELIGKLLADIQASERGKNAIIILTTDHGDGLPRAKRMLYDSGLRVPMILAYSDGREAGTTRDDLVSFVDLAPTILNFAGTSVPDYIQGQIFEGRNKEAQRDYIYAAADRLDEREQRFKAVRDARYKYIRNYTTDKPRLPDIGYQNNSPIMVQMREKLAEATLAPESAKYFITPSPHEELYDLSNDPHEIKNLVDEKESASILSRYQKAMDSWISRTGDLSAMSETEMVAQMWPGGKQPETLPPTACLTSSNKVQFSSATLGASIGYGPKANASWKLYTKPIAVDEASTTIFAKSVRYGYAESSISRVVTDGLPACKSR